jgi:hypothetical protein
MTRNNPTPPNNQQSTTKSVPPAQQKPTTASPIPQKPITTFNNDKGAKLPPITTRGSSSGN